MYYYFHVARDTKIFYKFQVHFILSRVEYATKNNVKKFGINKLLDTGIYKAAFPLHDVSPVLIIKICLEIEVLTISVEFITKDKSTINCLTLLLNWLLYPHTRIGGSLDKEIFFRRTGGLKCSSMTKEQCISFRRC